MKKYLTVACSLPLFSTTATFAQSSMGNILPYSKEAGDANGAPPKVAKDIVIDRGFKRAVNEPIVVGNSAFGGEARVTLRSDALVMETAIFNDMVDNHTDIRQVWSIPFSGSEEMEFQSDGNLVVRDSNNKVLWASNMPASRGKRLKVNFDGKLQVLNEDWFVVWEK